MKDIIFGILGFMLFIACLSINADDEFTRRAKGRTKK